MKERRLHRCHCGSKAEVWRLPIIGGYQIRCTSVDVCRNKTDIYFSEEYAADMWNEGDWKGKEG